MTYHNLYCFGKFNGKFNGSKVLMLLTSTLLSVIVFEDSKNPVMVNLMGKEKEGGGGYIFWNTCITQYFFQILDNNKFITSSGGHMNS